MQTVTEADKPAKDGKGPKYILNIEGNEVPWDRDTITTKEIANLGGWDISQGVIEVDQDNNERTLTADETVTIKPGQGFGKKHKWKRGS
ncbi:multiubiquitin domain-containing protein [Bradyrhizobium sp. UNPA324]|uniref:multiubiquitin domain-containing protein n=1 Tax=Bradyrhizobium sp. UNPA324 TaxID=1141174 RepID=UPI0015EEBB68|nr:multiubiquitin domain-containing protein [Bradyrhizobium sp. UNPA324]